MPSYHTQYLQSNDSYFSARALDISVTGFFLYEKGLDLYRQSLVISFEKRTWIIATDFRCTWWTFWSADNLQWCFMHRVWCLVPFISVLLIWHIAYTLHWRHNDHNGVSNHQPHGCLLNGLFRRRSKKTSKLRVTGFCVGNSPGPVNSPHKGPVSRKMFPFDDVIMYIKLCDTSVHIHTLHMKLCLCDHGPWSRKKNHRCTILFLDKVLTSGILRSFWTTSPVCKSLTYGWKACEAWKNTWLTFMSAMCQRMVWYRYVLGHL